MARSRVVLRHDVERIVADLPGMRRLLEKVAEAIAAETIRGAPEQSGRYKAGIAVEVGVDGRGRPVGRVNAHHWTSHIVEFGSVGQPPHAPMRRAIDSGVARRHLT